MTREPIDDTGSFDDRCGQLRTIADQTIIVRLLNPLVDDGSRPGIDHVWTENGRLVGKVARWDRVATIFREEDWHWIAFGEGLKFAVTGSHVRCGRATPLIRVQCVEIKSFCSVWSAHHVVLKHRSEDCRVRS